MQFYLMLFQTFKNRMLTSSPKSEYNGNYATSTFLQFMSKVQKKN